MYCIWLPFSHEFCTFPWALVQTHRIPVFLHLAPATRAAHTLLCLLQRRLVALVVKKDEMAERTTLLQEKARIGEMKITLWYTDLRTQTKKAWWHSTQHDHNQCKQQWHNMYMYFIRQQYMYMYACTCICRCVHVHTIHVHVVVTCTCCQSIHLSLRQSV